MPRRNFPVRGGKLSVIRASPAAHTALCDRGHFFVSVRAFIGKKPSNAWRAGMTCAIKCTSCRSGSLPARYDYNKREAGALPHGFVYIIYLEKAHTLF
jgi:hypothetical protein